MAEHKLWDGAALAWVPEGFDDVSRIRQVPDTQEVYCNADTDQCLIFELLELAEDHPAGLPALTYYAQDLSEANDSEISVPVAAESLKEHHPDDARYASRVSACVSGVSFQRVAKFHDAGANTLHVVLGLSRLPSVGTDVLITLSTPTDISPASSSAKTARSLASPEAARALMDRVMASFRIVDWSLFA